MLKNEDFAICEDCKNDRREYQSYVWDEQSQEKGIDKPKKESDHCMDRTRYLLHTTFGEDKLDYAKLCTW